METSRENLPFDKLDQMPPAEERRFWRDLERALSHDDGRAAKAHLAAGRPIYYEDSRYPGGVVRQYPDGRLELVDVDDNGEIILLRPLCNPNCG